ncbi:MAG TPA: amidohydrolase, partial [Gammaproteobacteria bacterium]
NLTPECFQALVEEGRRLHVQVIGHGVTQVGLERQLALGQVMVAHAEEFLYTVFSRPADVPGRPDSAPSVDEIPRVVGFVLRDKAFVTADLNTYGTIARQWGKPAVYQAMFESPEYKYLSPRERVEWRKAGYMKRSGDLSAKLAFLGTFTRKLVEAGVPLITGTDAPTIPGLVPGFSLHDDLQVLEDAGLSRYQVLSAATRVPGEFIDQYVPGAAYFGTVTVGSRADLILSSGDPLADLSMLRKPLGVMAAGKWYAAADLQAMLDHVAAEYAASAARP